MATVLVFDSAYSGSSRVFDSPYREVSPSIVVVTDVEAGNVAAGKVTVTNPDSQTPTIYADTRSHSAVTEWRHFLFAVENAQGKRPIFRFNRASKLSPTSAPTTEFRPLWTQDFKTYTRAPSRTLSGGSTGYIQWQFTDPLPAGRVFIVSHPLIRQTEWAAYVAELLATYPGVVTPTPSGNAQGVFATSPTETDDIGRAVGNNPMFAVKIAFGGPTTDGLRKRRLVLIGGTHAAGETPSLIAQKGFLDFFLTSQDATAVAMRKNWEIFVYGHVAPNGIRGGAFRWNFRDATNPNRDWYVYPQPSVLAEINAMRAAIVADTGSQADALFAWHTFGNIADPFIIAFDYRDRDPLTRDPAAQAFLDIGPQFFGQPPNIQAGGDGTTTQSFWGKSQLGAKVSVEAEMPMNGNTAPDFLEGLGVKWARTLNAVDEQGFFVAPPIFPAVGRAAGRGLKAGIAAPVNLAASVGRAAARGRKALLGIGLSIFAAAGPAVAAGLPAEVSQSIPLRTGAAVAAGLPAEVEGGILVLPAGTGAAVAAGLPASVGSPDGIFSGPGRGIAGGIAGWIEGGQLLIEAIPGLAWAYGLPANVSAGDEVLALVGRGHASGAQAIVSTDTTPPGTPPIYEEKVATPRPHVMDLSQVHADIAWGNFLAQYGESQRLEAVVRALYAPAEALSGALARLLDGRWLDTAEGRQLDGIGEIVGQGRDIQDVIYVEFFGFEGQPNTQGFGQARFRGTGEASSVAGTTRLLDAEYRKLLYWKIGINNGHGTAPEIAASLRAIFDATQVRIVDQGNARIGVWFNTTPKTNPAFLTNPLRWIPVAAGVGVEILTAAERRVFGFVNQGLYGFGVGNFARVERR